MKAIMIVIEDNDLSQYYANICLERWNEFGIYPEILPASTPGNTTGKLRFKNRKWNGNTFTDIEKAIWDSHYRAWEWAKEQGGGIILEHDCYPTRPLTQPFIKDITLFCTFPRNHKSWVKLKEKVAPGAGYHVTKDAAMHLIQTSRLGVLPIKENVDGHLYNVYKHYNQLASNEVESDCKEWLCAFQFLNFDKGTTAAHNGKVGK